TTSMLTSGVRATVFPVWSPNGRRIAFYAGEPDEEGDYSTIAVDVYCLDLATGKDEKLLSKLQLPAEVAGDDIDRDGINFTAPTWSPDSDALYVPQSGGYLKISLNDSSQVLLKPTLRDPCSDKMPGVIFWLRFSPFGGEAVFCGLPKPEDRDEKNRKEYGKLGLDLWRANSDLTDARRITKYPGDEYAPAWSPNGDRIAFMYGWEGVAQVAGVVDSEDEAKFFPYEDTQRLGITKLWLTIGMQFHQQALPILEHRDAAFKDAEDQFNSVHLADGADTDTQKLYSEIFQAIANRP
ncbi:MAG: hypothetical protein V2A74_06925, partial [bacterium]